MGTREEFDMKKKYIRELISTGLYLLGVLCITYLMITFVIQRTEVIGESMESTLLNGDNFFVDKISYRFKDPQRFDIIVFPFRHKENTRFVKRIIGLPGEMVQIDGDGNIYINGEELNEPYGKEVINPDKIGLAINPIELGEDEYFVMGDNRNHSTDSREMAVGNIHRDEIIGRAWLRIWPLNKFGVLKHQ